MLRDRQKLPRHAEPVHEEPIPDPRRLAETLEYGKETLLYNFTSIVRRLQTTTSSNN